MTPVEQLRLLSHDLGKYLARAARNFPDADPVPEVLVEMMMRDVWGDEGTDALGRFQKLVADAPSVRLELADVEKDLETLVGLEAAVRGFEPKAVRQAAALCVKVDADLRRRLEQRS